MITTQHIEEDLSKAYVMAIGARAGYSVDLDRPHDYTVDGTFHEIIIVENQRNESGYSIDFQLKASKNCVEENDFIKYDFDSNTYNYFIRRGNSKNSTPFILILLVLPDNPKEWLNITEESLILKKACYWYKIEKQEPTPNLNSKRIFIPKNQLLTPDSLQGLFKQVKEGELL